MRIDPKEIVIRLQNGMGIREVARALGVSPGTVLNWKRRATSHTGSLSTRSLKRKSTKHHAPYVRGLSSAERIEVVHLHTLYGWSAERIMGHMGLSDWSVIHRYLKRMGYIRSQTKHRRPRYQPTTHMHLKNVPGLGYLQMDVKFVTPELSGLPHTTFLVALIDIVSRYKVGALFPDHTEVESMAALEAAIQTLPFPVSFVQTDNGFEFQKRFHTHALHLGLTHHHIHKSSPNENAVIERSFRTDEEEFFFFFLPKWGRPASLMDLNEKYARYLHHYNTVRPHMGHTPMMTPHAKILTLQNPSL